MRKPIRAILFDMDGVLVNAKSWHYDALNQSLVDFHYEPIAYEDHIANYDGLPTSEKLKRLAKKQSIPFSQFPAINDLKQKYTVEIAREKCKPLPQHIDTLRRLEKDNYRMAVCSNSVRASLDLLLQKTNLIQFFEFTLSSQDVKKPKPDPEIYNMAMKRMDIPASETIILEDNIFGIQAARASGATVIEIGDIAEVEYSQIVKNIKRIENENAR